MGSEAEIAEAIASVGPLFDGPVIEATNAASGQTAEEAASEVKEAVAALEGEAPPKAEGPAAESPPPPEEPMAKRLALVAREKARVEAERAKIKVERESLAADRREVEEYRARRANAKADPFAFLRGEGLEFEDIARDYIAKAEPPKAKTSDDVAREALERAERLEKELDRREQQARYNEAVGTIKGELAKFAPTLPELGRVMRSPEALRALEQIGFGDPSDRVVEMIAEVWRNGGEAVIDGKHYVWPRGTELAVDVAARATDNVLMQLLAPLRGAGNGTEATPTADPKEGSLAESSRPGKSATRPRTLSNTRASTPTSPAVRESRSYSSDEDEIRDLARQFDVWK